MFLGVRQERGVSWGGGGGGGGGGEGDLVLTMSECVCRKVKDMGPFLA